MAYQSYFPTEDEKKKTAGQGGSVIVGAQGGSSAIPSSGQGSGFVNLDKYLQANQGQSQGLADALTGGYQQKVGDFKTSVQQANEAAQEQIQQKTKQQETQSLVDSSGKAATGNDVPTWAQNAAGVINNPYQYGLGTDTQNSINEIMTQQKKLESSLNNLGDRYVQQSSFRDLFNPSGTYSSGFGALDTFLLNADPNSRQQIEQTKQLAGQLDASPLDQSAIKGYEDQAAATYAANQARIRDAASGLQQDYQGRYQQAAQEAANRNALLDEQYNVLNKYLEYISGAPGELYQGLDLSGLVSKEGDFSARNFFADQDATDLAAINSLLGQPSEFDTEKRYGNVGIDYERLRNMGRGTTGNWEFEYDPATNEIKRRFVNYDTGPQRWSSSNIADIDPALAAYIAQQGY